MPLTLYSHSDILLITYHYLSLFNRFPCRHSNFILLTLKHFCSSALGAVFAWLTLLLHEHYVCQNIVLSWARSVVACCISPLTCQQESYCMLLLSISSARPSRLLTQLFVLGLLDVNWHLLSTRKAGLWFILFFVPVCQSLRGFSLRPPI